MDQQVILWVLGAIIMLLTTVIGALAQAMWDHTKDCREFRITIAASNATVSAKLDRVIEDIGDHQSGLRGQVHKMAQDISPFLIHKQSRHP